MGTGIINRLAKKGNDRQMIILKEEPNIIAEENEAFEEYVKTFHRKNFTLKFNRLDNWYTVAIVLVGKTIYKNFWTRTQYKPTKRDYEAVFKHLSKKFPKMIDRLELKTTKNRRGK